MPHEEEYEAKLCEHNTSKYLHTSIHWQTKEPETYLIDAEELLSKIKSGVYVITEIIEGGVSNEED